MRDVLCLVGLVAGFAFFLTAHLTIVFGLLRRIPRWRGPLALLIPPLAPFWAFRVGMPVRGGIWIASLVIYAVAYASALL